MLGLSHGFVGLAGAADAQGYRPGARFFDTNVALLTPDASNATLVSFDHELGRCARVRESSRAVVVILL
jgi:hypothetical protein